MPWGLDLDLGLGSVFGRETGVPVRFHLSVPGDLSLIRGWADRL